MRSVTRGAPCHDALTRASRVHAQVCSTTWSILTSTWTTRARTGSTQVFSASKRDTQHRRVHVWGTGCVNELSVRVYGVRYIPYMCTYVIPQYRGVPDRTPRKAQPGRGGRGDRRDESHERSRSAESGDSTLVVTRPYRRRRASATTDVRDDDAHRALDLSSCRSCVEGRTL